ncbi:cell division protein CrgA [Tomitella fengzijianii]|uniref:Cell division protein CrgA n=1 Tax=Tomitella fengzijianii TaxID=2597660 RepID=A0A516WZ34_9ACTN|nr:cell division protein CrgA [Tomitella fengzijianii]QDQ96098.1 cell division protein CrgA [Tomitella fengzijianii]
MPKSKVRKKKGGDAAAAPNRTPVKVAGGPSSTLYVSVMLGLMVIGLAWLILMYLSGSASWLTWMSDLGGWNYLIGFGFMVAGLLMTMGWR